MVLTKLQGAASNWIHRTKPDENDSSVAPRPPGNPSTRFTYDAAASQSSAPRSSFSYWNYANDAIKGAAEHTYSSIAHYVSSTLYTNGLNDSYRSYKNWYQSPPPQEGAGAGASDSGLPFIWSPRRSALRRNSNISSRELAIMFKNPYEHVRGRHPQRSSSSVSAIRSLLTLVPQTLPDDRAPPPSQPPFGGAATTDGADEDPYSTNLDDSWAATTPGGGGGAGQGGDRAAGVPPPFVSPAETACQIAEGTIRALRDLALDEAVELHAALRFWNERWERPVLSWLEAGPDVWTRPGGYNHQAVGRRVAQIQAVLARRCATIGELQTHLLRAGWHKGVAQWGVLGDGGQWSAVAGFDRLSGDGDSSNRLRSRTMSAHDAPTGVDPDSSKVQDYYLGELAGRQSIPSMENMTMGQSEANIFVEKVAGGGLMVDDPAFLSEWSIEGIRLVRQQLERAANGMTQLPGEDNWTYDHLERDTGELILDAPKSSTLPNWAKEISIQLDGSTETYKELSIVDLPEMIHEVSELIDVMEPIMSMQRQRRLERLRPPSWARRNWLLLSTTGPCLGYIVYQMLRNDYAKEAWKHLVQKVKDFCRERIQEPMSAIIQEIWKGRAPFSDREARLEAIESLKKMIRNWLDENHPELPMDQRESLAANMDVTLIEKQKVESMKTFFEINKVIQMSFIEMQYMKKEMLNALEAIDQMLSANDINMNVAAITPVAMLIYLSSRFFKFIYYALLKLGKSREETYASLRSILTDVERLLVMRDNPPEPPPLPGRPRRNFMEKPAASIATVLNPDDLGMLMLLLHGCRQILWNEQRRFPSDTIRSVSEDLAELAGERGPVSVQQQLLIINRMSRTYPFLKVISTGNVGSSRLIRS